MKRTICTVVTLSIAAAGCATASRDVPTAYVSPLQYQAFDCDQLASETGRIQQRVQQLGGRLDQAAANDKALTGFGVILFWPALFALGGTKEQEAEYGRMKGEYEALQQAAVGKRCAIRTASREALAQPASAAGAGTTPPATEPAVAPATPSSRAPG